jgi:hypothetical protein
VTAADFIGGASGFSNGSVTAGEFLGGVRPSSGAASAESPDAPSFITARLPSNIAAPEDGRTPPSSLSPSLTHYRFHLISH